MATKFSNFNNVANPSSSTIIVGLDGGLNSQFTIGTIGLDQLNGVLPVIKGGTGVGSLTAGRILLGDGTNAIATLDATVKGNIITGYTHPITGIPTSTTVLVGADKTVLTADSSDPKGVVWSNVVEANPGGAPVLTLDTVKIHGTDYEIDSGTVVVANPGGNPPTALNTITIGATDYNIPSSSGGVSAFTTITTDNATGEAEWDIAADGPNIFFQPTAGQPNLIVLAGGTTPADGASGYLVLDPSQSGQFQLPPDAKINNGQVFTGGTNLVLYSWVYDGTYFYWQRDINLIDPIYAPFNPFPTQNLIGVWDPVTINPGFLLAGNPYDDAIVPDDPANAGDIAVNYGVPSTGSWTNSITNSGVIDELIASTNPESTSTLYKPSFVVNGVGSLALATYNAASTPAVIVPNPTGGSVVNTQTFFTQDFNASSAGSYALSASEITIENGSIGSGSGVTATVTSDGSDCTAIQITNGGSGYSRGDLLKLDMNASTIGTGEIYILLETAVMSDIIPCVQFGHPTEAEFGAATYNEGYDFQNTSFATAQNNILTVMMWIHGPYPLDGQYNALFDVRDTGGSAFNEALYFDGTTGYFDTFSPTTTFNDLPKLKNFTSFGGVNFYNQWTFFCFTYFPNGNSGFIATFLANQDTLNNANTPNWDYAGGSEPTVAVDADGFCTSTKGSLLLNESNWDELSIGNTFSDEGFRAKIGKVAVYNAIVPGASIIQAWNTSKGYYGIT